MDVFKEDYLIDLKKFLRELMNEIKHEKKYSYYLNGLKRIISHIELKEKIIILEAEKKKGNRPSLSTVKD